MKKADKVSSLRKKVKREKKRQSTDRKKAVKNSRYRGRVDRWLLLFTVLLILVGIVTTTSASNYTVMVQTGKHWGLFLKSIFWTSLGAGIMYAASLVDYRKWKRLCIPMLVIGVILLLLIFTPLGSSVNGARRWLVITRGITIMPGEWAKMIMIIFAASYLSGQTLKQINSIKTFCFLAAVGGFYAGLILMQPNFSTALINILVIGTVWFIAGAYWKWLSVLSCVAVVIGAKSILMAEYRMKRLFAFFDITANQSGDNFQIIQSLVAISSGGLSGVGPGNSIQKKLYLPEAQNDFIFSIIGEEFGFIGIMILMLLYVGFLYCGFKIIMREESFLALLLGGGIVSMIGIQLLLNIVVVTALLPASGIILPFVSFGGNAMLVTCMATGILMNISRQQDKKEQEEADRLSRESFQEIN